MPTAQTIKTHLMIAANEAVALAIVWHVLGVAAIAVLLLGWRPSVRLAGALLALPIASAAAVALAFDNPFNATVLGSVAVALVALAWRMRSSEVALGSSWMAVAGALMMAFGLVYPHFLVTRSLLTYLYAAPTGIVPCPTLSLVIGFALLGGGLGARAWSVTLAVAGLFYGVFGVMRLGVLLDLPLIAGAVALIVGVSTRKARADRLQVQLDGRNGNIPPGQSQRGGLACFARSSWFARSQA